MSNPLDPLAQPNQGLDVPAVRAEIRRIALLINEARDVIGHGNLVPLNGLEVLIRHVCSQAASLEKGQGRQVRSDLEALVYELDSLETDMTSRFGSLARRSLDDAPRPPTVGAAYKAGVDRAAQVERQRAQQSAGASAASSKTQDKPQ
jgi:hypothetical protein